MASSPSRATWKGLFRPAFWKALRMRSTSSSRSSTSKITDCSGIRFKLLKKQSIIAEPRARVDGVKPPEEKNGRWPLTSRLDCPKARKQRHRPNEGEDRAILIDKASQKIRGRENVRGVSSHFFRPAGAPLEKSADLTPTLPPSMTDHERDSAR